MWIPDKGEVSKRDYLVLFNKLITLLDSKKELRDLFIRIADNHDQKPPTKLAVSTGEGTSAGMTITPIEAHFLNELGFLSEQKRDWERHTYVDRYYFWRELDVVKLFEFLDDANLPAPLE